MRGFGGPPAHIALLRRLVVDRQGWMDTREFEDANAACGLLPGPASTQLAIFCAYRVGGPAGAIVGGLGFVVPAVALILALSVLFLGHAPPIWIARRHATRQRLAADRPGLTKGHSTEASSRPGGQSPGSGDRS